jgi:hypothetical protein
MRALAVLLMAWMSISNLAVQLTPSPVGGSYGFGGSKQAHALLSVTHDRVE